METDINNSLAALKQRYRDNTPRSARLFEQAERSLPAGNTRNNLYFSPYMPFMDKAEGALLTDVDGNSYIDFLNDFTVCVAGHSHPALIAAAGEQLNRGMSFGACTAAETRLAEELQRRFPQMARLRFANSGTEANLYAVKTALAASAANKVLVFEGNYHGGVLNYAWGGNNINLPLDTVVCPYNDVEAFEKLFAEHRNELAVVVMELMLNTGGCIPAETAFVKRVRELTADASVTLIVDEVMTARLGYHGLQGEFGIEADLTTLGKMIGGGFSAGAFGGRKELMNLFDARESSFVPHGGSFNNNVMSMNVGSVALEQVLTEKALAELNTNGDTLRKRLNTLLDKQEVPLVFSGVGSVMNLHFGYQPPTASTADPRGKQAQSLFHAWLLLHGFWVASRGLIALSLANTAAHVDQLLDCVEGFVNEHRDQLRQLENSHA